MSIFIIIKLIGFSLIALGYLFLTVSNLESFWGFIEEIIKLLS